MSLSIKCAQCGKEWTGKGKRKHNCPVVLNRLEKIFMSMVMMAEGCDHFCCGHKTSYVCQAKHMVQYLDVTETREDLIKALQEGD